MVLAQLHGRLPDAALTGVDLSFGMLRAARSDNVLGVPLVQSVVENLPFADNSFDLIYALGVVDYVDKPAKFFAAVQRILKPGGHFIFTYPNGDSINRNFRQWLRDRITRSESAVAAKPIKTVAIDKLIESMEGELEQRSFITYGNGILTFPWSVATSRTMERWGKDKSASRYIAWTGLCVVRKVEATG
jgi:ubiquinone/menaquinone biosynthesis C-methylase UbiE